MNRILVVLITLIVLAGGGYVAWQNFGPGEPAQETDTPPPLESVLEEDAPETGQGERTDTASAETTTSESGDGDFVFTRLQIDTSGDQPEACLVFSEDLDRANPQSYETYLKIEPEVRPGLRVSGPLLCLGGLSFETMYQVTLRKGLPAASGKRLAFDETVPVQLRDREPAIAFGSGVILPREDADGVPITTVNVEKVDLRIIRVGDRLLSQLRTGLLDEKELYGWEAEDMQQEKGALVWQGSMRVAAPKNKTVKTIFPLRDALTRQEPGAYLLLARNGDVPDAEQERWRPSAAQWVIDSDLGITSFRGRDGLHVFLRSLNEATTLSGVRVELIAVNNQILASGKTDSSGMVRFDAGLVRGEGGARPAALMAYGEDGDFNYLDLRLAAFDLSDRGVSGRAYPGPIDAYLYLDRGIYRPGETVHVTAMLRDQTVDAIDATPLTIIVRRPDGVEYRRVTLNEQLSGGAYFAVDLSRTAPRGRWTAAAYIDPEAPAVGRVQFDVQDFVPERLEVTLEPRQQALSPAGSVDIDVSARFLYGAPASGLSGEAEARLRVDPAPYPQYKDYRFGRVKEEFNPSRISLSVSQTDAEGKAKVSGTLEPVPDTTKPLKADITVAMFEPGGRMTREQVSLPVRTKPLMIGVRPNFEGSSVRENTEAAFDVVALNPDGERVGRAGLSWRIVREVVNYQWYQLDGRWRYERIVRDRPIDAGTIDAGLSGRTTVAKTLSWGTYRMVVADAETGAATSVRFYVGWYGDTGADRPDLVTVGADKDLYRAGDTARINIRPPVGGKALVTVAGDQIFSTRMIDLPDEGRTVDIPIKEEWGPGAYVMVSAYRPLGEGPSRAPVRAIGLTYLKVDQSKRTLAIELDAPSVAAPQRRLDVPVQVTLSEDGSVPQSAFVTLAAVDQGILQLTDFQSPAPTDHYFGKRRLAVDIRDDYGRLIRDGKGTIGEIRVGGDGDGAGAGLNVVPTKTVALFSGIVALDSAGRAVIPLELPDFAGELRLMAVAFSPSAVGEADRPLTVRREIVGEVTLPRFLAPGDAASATLLVHNVEGRAGDYRAEITSEGAVAGTSETLSLSLAKGERRQVRVGLSGGEAGLGKVLLKLTGPDGFQLNRSWDIEVRPSALAEVTETTTVLSPGQSVTIDPAPLNDYEPGSRSLAVSLSTSRGYDVPGLLKALSRYPYGCLEQTTSRAFPLLYYNDVARLSGLEGDQDLRERVQLAVNKVVDLQTSSGAFGMWSLQGGEANLWISVFALDFLTEAREKGLVVPSDALRRGSRFLRDVASQEWRPNEARAYAYYVLAKNGAANVGEMRYFHDTKRTEFTDGMTAGLLAGALDLVGDRARAKVSFDQAVRLVTRTPAREYETIAYGSLLRDVAGVTALAARAGRTQLLPALFDRSEDLDRRARFTTTQEQAWMLLAAYELGKARGRLRVEVTGTDPVRGGDPTLLAPSEDELAAGVGVRNAGDGDIFRTVTVQGVPSEPLPAAQEGVTLSKSYYTVDGRPADLTNLVQNERLVVLINGQMDDDTYREMAIIDLLPAGLELEAAVPGGDNGGGLYDWLPGITFTSATTLQDDRFTAAFDIGRRYRPRNDDKIVRPNFAVAYVARVVTPGDFALPAAKAEDMYAPRVFARTDMRRMRINPAGGEN